MSAELPEFVSVTAWAALVVLTTWFPNESEAGERLTGELVPVPVTLAVCGLSLALSVTVRVTVLAPTLPQSKVVLSRLRLAMAQASLLPLSIWSGVIVHWPLASN